MGSSRPRHSTRVRKRRSTSSQSKVQRPPDPPKQTTTSGVGAGESANVTGALVEGAPVEALKAIHLALDHAQSITIICTAALRHENTFIGEEAAKFLRRDVSDEIDRQIERIDGLLGREKTYADDDEGEAE